MLHKCLVKEAPYSDCYNECAIYSYCGIIRNEIKEFLNSKLNDFNDDIKKDLVADIINEIRKNIKNFKGSTKSQLVLYVRKIFNRMLADYFKSKNKLKKIHKVYADEKFQISIRQSDNLRDSEAEIEIAKKDETTPYTDALRKEISEIIYKDFSRILSDEGYGDCADRLVEYYESLKLEISRKELASKRGEKENTYNQALKRCLERLRKIIEKRGLSLSDFL